MRIRGKLLVLLLLVAVVPLVLAAAIGQYSTRRVGFGLASVSQRALEDRAMVLLLQLAEDDALLFRREVESLALAVQVQARSAARAIAGLGTGDPRPVLFAEDYDREEGMPTDFGPAEGYERIDPDGSATPIPVTFENQVFVRAPGVSRDSVGGYARLLSAMPEVYALVRSAHERMIHWQYTALENGLHTSYPGHGGYPEGFDARARPWYTDTLESGLPVYWNEPLVDASTRKVMISVCAPVLVDGEPVGVSAMDIELPDMLDPAKLPGFWAERGRAFLVASAHREGSGEGLVVFAERGYERDGTSWEDPVELRRLVSRDAESFDAMMADLAAHRSGIRRMERNGVDSLWAYAPLWQDDRVENNPALVLIVPHEDVVRDAVAAKRRAQREVYGQLGANIGSLLLVVGLVLVIAWFVSRNVTRPVLALSEAAKRLAGGDLETRAKVRGRDELNDLASAFNTMVPKLADRLKLRESLNLAMEVQQNLLPGEAPTLEGLDVAGSSDYCDETGGDYYDFLDLAPLGPGRLGIALGDVTGHGIAAALLMTTARALLRSRIDQPGSLVEQFGDINAHLCADTGGEKFMTLFFLVMDTNAGVMRWISAGHDPAVVYDRHADSFSELEGEDLPLGIEASWSFNEFDREILRDGEVLVIATDGVWEARDDEDALFGKERMNEVIRANADKPAAEIAEAIQAAVRAYRGGVPQLDDITLVVIKAVES